MVSWISPTARAAAAASKADVAIVFVGTTSQEGSDRPTLGLGSKHDNLVKAVAHANPNTIVCVVSPGAVLLPWDANVSSILLSHMPGQEYGLAIAEILLEWHRRLAACRSLPNIDNEEEFTKAQFPGVDGHSVYIEGLLIGYRWYDHHKIKPLYAFGHGLSYSAFEYSALRSTSMSTLRPSRRPSLSTCRLQSAMSATARRMMFRRSISAIRIAVASRQRCSARSKK